MPLYSYLAKSLQGEEKKGILFAKDLDELTNLLKNEGYMLVSAKEKREKNFLSFFSSVSLKEKLFFTRNLSVMLSAGLSLTRALATLSVQTKNKKFQSVILQMKDAIEKGNTFSDTISSFKNIFSEFYESMVRVGEESGTLVSSLNSIARKLEKDNDLRSKIIGALIYPAFIVLVMVIVLVLMLVMVVPKLAETFEELEIELPPTTKFVIFVGTFCARNILLIILFFIGFIFLMNFIIRTKPGKKVFDYLVLRIPIIGNLIKNTLCASILRNLSTLIAAAVPLPRALEITANTLGNVYYRESLNFCQTKVKQGEKLSDAFKKFPFLYPPIFIEMVSVGEETGQTTDILQKLASFYEKEVLRTTKNLTSIIEPFLIVLIGGGIGFFAVAMIQPIYSMMGQIK